MIIFDYKTQGVYDLFFFFLNKDILLLIVCIGSCLIIPLGCSMPSQKRAFLKKDNPCSLLGLVILFCAIQGQVTTCVHLADCIEYSVTKEDSHMSSTIRVAVVKL